MKSLDLKHGIPGNLWRKSGVMIGCSPPVKGSGVQASLGAFFIKVNLGQNGKNFSLPKKYAIFLCVSQ